MAELHPTIAEKYRMKKGGFVSFSLPKLGFVDMRVTPLSVIEPYIKQIDYLEAVEKTAESKEEKKK